MSLIEASEHDSRRVKESKDVRDELEKRKIIQITASGTAERQADSRTGEVTSEAHETIYALCNDGRVFYSHPHGKNKWFGLSLIPQPPKENK